MFTTFDEAVFILAAAPVVGIATGVLISIIKKFIR